MKKGTLPAFVLGVALLAPSALPCAAQAVRLGQPTAAFPEDFGAVQTVRELPDGRVLVADPLGQALYLVDLDAGTRTVVGSRGAGPQQYQQPDAVWPLPGDSTLLVDLGNGRLVTLTPGLAFGPTRPIASGTPEPGRPLVLALPQGVDRRGNLYVRPMGGGGPGATPPESASVLRLDRRSDEAVPVATIKLPSTSVDRSGGSNQTRVAMRPIPLSPEDAWGVAPDGSIAVARSGEYRLEWIRPDGTVVRGPAVPYRPVPVRKQEKEEYLLEQGRAGGGVRVGMQAVGDQVSMTFGRGGGGRGAPSNDIDAYTWPDHKPPFYGGSIPMDGEGRAWLRRHVPAGQPATYDVFDGGARRVGTVVLPPDRTVIGFGERGVYVVAYDEFDLSYLERYAPPALAGR